MGGKTKGSTKVTRIIVCDTGPLLHLSETGAIHLLSLAGEILIPSMVAKEFEANAQGWKPPQWVKILELDEGARQQAAVWIESKKLDAGEAEAIGLALQTKADWLLTDDALARQFAESLDLEVHGSIGLLLWNIARGNIENQEQALNLLDNLAQSSLWVSERVLQEARKAIIGMFS
jgi:predicted nucleic acid-binding protein